MAVKCSSKPRNYLNSNYGKTNNTTVQQDECKAEKCSENDNFEGKRSRAILKQHMDLTSHIA